MNALSLLNGIRKKAIQNAVKESSMGGDFTESYEREIERAFYNLEESCKLYSRLEDLLIKYKITKGRTLEELQGNWFFISLRPPPHMEDTFEDFHETVSKAYVPRKMFLNGSYCFEQCGKTLEELGKGFHCHLLMNCRKGLMKTQVVKDTKSTFRKYLRGEVPDAFVDVKYIRTEADWNRCVAYMDGNKADNEKDEAVALNDKWRASVRVESLYQVQEALK